MRKTAAEYRREAEGYLERARYCVDLQYQGQGLICTGNKAAEMTAAACMAQALFMAADAAEKEDAS